MYLVAVQFPKDTETFDRVNKQLLDLAVDGNVENREIEFVLRISEWSWRTIKKISREYVLNIALLEMIPDKQMILKFETIRSD